MSDCKVTAIIRNEKLEEVERQLQEIGAPGISVTCVKGFGEYANFFSRDWLCPHARIEIFCEERQAQELARAIAETAHTGAEGDGIVAIIPVSTVYRIRTKEPWPEQP